MLLTAASVSARILLSAVLVFDRASCIIHTHTHICIAQHHKILPGG
jgi:hypothetical protein